MKFFEIPLFFDSPCRYLQCLASSNGNVTRTDDNYPTGMLNINQLGCKWSITAHHHDATQPGHKNVPPLRWLHLSSIIYTPLCLPGQRGVVEVEGEGGGGAGLASHLYTYYIIYYYITSKYSRYNCYICCPTSQSLPLGWL